ncbi:MAG TPA: hypothetical protein VL334_05650 [Anaerolineae bacterium]|nr:hypothetical protein [Anaerolineae bacterium]
MARKETPDVLGEVLTGVGETPAVSPAPAPPPAIRKTRSPRAPKEPAAAPEPPAPATPLGWDYLVVSFSEYRGWRPRFINGQEVRNWMHAPLIHDYLAQLGEDGWELAGAGGGKALYGASDYYQAFFKRPKR